MRPKTLLFIDLFANKKDSLAAERSVNDGSGEPLNGDLNVSNKYNCTQVL